MRTAWVSSALPMDSIYWLGSGPASLLALLNANAPTTPIPAGAFYETLDVWLLGLGAPSSSDLWCYDNATGLAADCFDRLPPVANKQILIGAVRGVFSLVGQTTTAAYVAAIAATRAAVDGGATSHAVAVRDADPGFRLFVGGTTYQYYDQYIHIWGDLYRLVGLSLLGVFCVTLLYEPDLALAIIVCTMILMVCLIWSSLPLPSTLTHLPLIGILPHLALPF
jgi:hypothetical protein